jgi:chromosome partitioning protein
MNESINNNGHKPPSRLLEPSGRQSSPYLIAVANQKGGVAKTTSVLSIGGALVQYGNEVLVVDLDPQANLTLSLGYEPAKLNKTITEAILNPAKLEDYFLDTSIPGLSIFPANQRLADLEKNIQSNGNNNKMLQIALSTANPQSLKKYNFIIFDCPPSIGFLTLNALSASNLLIIPTQPEYYSVIALKSMMQLIRQVREQTNPQLTYRILITMLDKRNRIHRSLAEQIKLTFGEGLLHTTIETDTKLRESSLAGLPIQFYRQQSRSSIQYSTLAQEILAYVQMKVPYAD